MVEPGYVCVVASLDPDAIRIGWSIDPWRRLGELQAGCPQRLGILGCVLAPTGAKYAMHEKFAEWRIDGSEWFSVPEHRWHEVLMVLADLVTYGDPFLDDDVPITLD